MKRFFSKQIAILLVVGSFILSPVNVVLALNHEDVTPTPIDYQLPYPGLLPDHPFYFLKQFRDALFLFFISDSLEKAEYNLLQADKHVEASIMLLDKKKNVDLAAETFSQAVISYEASVAKAIETKRQGIYTKDFFRKLVTANKKHQEIGKGFAEQYPEKFERNKKKLEELGKKVSVLVDQK